MRRTWCGGSGSVRIHYVTSVDVLSTTGIGTAGILLLVHPPVSYYLVVYYELRKTELQIRLMNEGRCDARLVMKDLERNLRNLHVSHTLGSSGNWNT